MAELIQDKSRVGKNRFWLLSTVSILAASNAVCAFEAIGAESEAETPSVWVEIGGQLERVNGGLSVFSPSFLEGGDPELSIAPLGRASRYSNGAQLGIEIKPAQSSWLFAASLRYGRSNSARHVHHETQPGPMQQYRPPISIPPYIYLPSQHYTFTPYTRRFVEATAKHNETHAVLDFQVGRDVGIGLFGKDGSSILNFGVRLAQFTAKSNSAVYGDVNYEAKYNRLDPTERQTYAAFSDIKHSFIGVGPLISLNASTSVLGNRETMDVTFDFGLNAAVLFGRQKTDAQIQTSSHYLYYPRKYGDPDRPAAGSHTIRSHSIRTRSIVVPNVGGMAGVSFRYDNAKLSLGYRADFFLGAMDGGIDTRKTYDRNFYGPFATLTVGLGG